MTPNPPEGQAERREGQSAEERGEPCCPDCGAYSDEPSGWTIMEGPLNGTHLDCDDPFHTQPTGPERTKEHIERMRELTESVGERNAKIHGSKTSGGALLEGRTDRPLRDQPASPPEESWEPDRALADLDTIRLRERVEELEGALALDTQADPHDPVEFAKTIVAENARLRKELRRITWFIPDSDWTHGRLLDELATVAEIAEAALADHREGEE